MEDFLATVLSRPADTIRGKLLPNLFCAIPNFVVLKKICFKNLLF